NLGRIHAVAREWDQAIEYLERALALDPGEFEVSFNLGNARLQQGDLPKAVEAFENAWKLQPDNLLAINMLAQALTRTGRPADALNRLNEALVRHPNSPEVLYNAGQIHLHNGRPA